MFRCFLLDGANQVGVRWMYSLEDAGVSVLPDGPCRERDQEAQTLWLLNRRICRRFFMLELILSRKGYGSLTPATTKNPHFIVKISDMMTKLMRF